MPNAELRTDIFTGRQVIVAPTRANRPNASSSDPSLLRPDDPFEAGMEHETPGEHWALRIRGTAANTPGWQVRIVPNRYPAIDQSSISLSAGLPGFEASTDSEASPDSFEGVHDVVIECPDRRHRMFDLSAGELQEVLRAWQIRIRDFEQTRQIRSVVVFRNEGFSAGASLAHCHSQIVATSIILPEIAQRKQRAVDYRTRCGQHLSEAWLNSELSAKTRIVATTDLLVALCPFASHASWQCRIVPRLNSEWTFGSLSTETLQELTQLLKRCHTALVAELGHCSFNLLMVHPPLGEEPAYPWMLEIVPRLSRTAGWEMLTGIEIITMSPEEAASQVRSRLATQSPERTSAALPHAELEWIRGS